MISCEWVLGVGKIHTLHIRTLDSDVKSWNLIKKKKKKSVLCFVVTHAYVSFTL